MKYIYIYSTFLVIFLFCSCRTQKYYLSDQNPSSISIELLSKNDSLSLVVGNNGQSPIKAIDFIKDLKLILTPRFYKQEYILEGFSIDLNTIPSTIQPKHKYTIKTIAINQLFDSNTLYKSKNKVQKIKLKSQPYVYVRGSIQSMVNTNSIEIRSKPVKLITPNVTKQKPSKSKYDLVISSTEKEVNSKNIQGKITCLVKNNSTYPIYLFQDIGSVRFKFYAYNPNRTAIMNSEFKLVDNKLPISSLTISPNDEKVVYTINYSELFFKENSDILYWSWSKKNPPISPLVYNDKKLVPNIELWFGIVVDGKEYLSNTVNFLVK